MTIQRYDLRFIRLVCRELCQHKAHSAYARTIFMELNIKTNVWRIMMGHLIKRSSMSFGFDCVELHVKRLGLLIFIRMMVELLVRFVATVFCERMLFKSFYEGIQIEFTWRMNRDSSKRMKVFCMNMNWAAYLSKGLPFLYTKRIFCCLCEQQDSITRTIFSF